MNLLASLGIRDPERDTGPLWQAAEAVSDPLNAAPVAALASIGPLRRLMMRLRYGKELAQAARRAGIHGMSHGLGEAEAAKEMLPELLTELGGVRSRYPGLEGLPGMSLELRGPVRTGDLRGEYRDRMAPVATVVRGERQQGPLGLGGMNVGTTMPDAARHELGHHIYRSLPAAQQRQFEKLLADNPQLARQVSSYASASPDEAFAESMAAFTHPEHGELLLPAPVAEYLRELLYGMPPAWQTRGFLPSTWGQAIRRGALLAAGGQAVVRSATSGDGIRLNREDTRGVPAMMGERE